MTDKPSLIECLSDAADLCRNDGADDIASLLDEARQRIERLEEATVVAANIMRDVRQSGIVEVETNHD